jgi:hypothetical protein
LELQSEPIISNKTQTSGWHKNNGHSKSDRKSQVNKSSQQNEKSTLQPNEIWNTKK